VVRKDFSEVGHTGGVATFNVKCDADGHISYQVGYSGSAPRPMTLVGVWAHSDGFACGNIRIGGIGDTWNAPPLPNCFPVLMASDSEGRFGHECPICHKHCRSENIPALYQFTCPYCGLRRPAFEFLTPPQKAYVGHYIRTLLDAIHSIDPGSEKEVTINMDELADAVPGEPRPDFYYSSTTQQTEFRCAACNCFNDIRGKFGYCASCGSRNNVAVLKASLSKMRDRVNAKEITPENAVRQAVSEFDSLARDLVSQLAERIPMKESRRKKAKSLLFHNIDRANEFMNNAFDIELLRGTNSSQKKFLRMMFLRRHAYEHDGGVATQRYVEESGDTGIEQGSLIRETIENIHNFIGLLERIADTLDADFREIFPTEPFCIELERDRKKRMVSR
jgi:hypothetical protein